MNTTAELAASMRRLAKADTAELTDDERAALLDAAAKLDRGQGPVYVIGRLLAPFLARLGRGKA